MKKGFTLIELLAVVIVLALLSLIVTPQIMKVVENSARKAFATTAYGIIHSVDIYYTEIMKNMGEKLFVFPQEEKDKLKLEGKEPKGGKVHVNEEGDIAIAIYNGKWCAIKGYEEQAVTVRRYQQNRCDLPIDGDTPVLTLNPPLSMNLSLHTIYNEPGYTLKTYSGKDLDPNLVTITGTVDTAKVGEYILTYSAAYKDKTVLKTRKIEVMDMVPTVLFEPNEQLKSVQNQMVKITVIPVLQNTVEKFMYTILKENQVVETKEVIGNQTEVLLNQDGIYTIQVDVTDSANNKGTKKSGIYKIDTMPPELTIPPDTQITKSKVPDFSLMDGVSAVDNSGEEVAITMEGSLDAVEGEYTIIYTATDTALNCTTKTRKITVMNGEAPIINSYPNGTSDWVSSVLPTLIVTDDIEVQVFTYQLEKDGALGTEQTVLVTGGNTEQVEIAFPESGTYRIIASATDNDGMISTFTSEKFYIDKMPPTVSFTVVGSPFNSYNWSKQDVKVSVKISDDHTPKSFLYCTTTASTCNPTTTVSAVSKEITLTGESATNKICVKAYDMASNESSIICSPNYAIDKTPPSAPTITKNVEKVTIKAGTDSLSGIDRSTYLLSGATNKVETNYTTDVVISNVGTTNVTAYTYDKAGNKSSGASLSGNNGVMISEASCYDKNMISQDGYCQKIIAATKNEVCTKGGFVMNGVCKYSALANTTYTHTCPSGYSLTEGTPQSMTGTCTGSATKACYLGTLRGDTCVWDIGIGNPTYSAPYYKCSGGGMAYGSICKITATTRKNTVYNCYLGGTLVGSDCDTGAPLVTYTCDEGNYYDASLKTCLVKTDACPSGSTYNFITGKCYK